jgi:protein-tyrosine phosphatase
MPVKMAIVSLLDRNEIYELGLENEPELCLKHDIEFIHFPIIDRTVPKQDVVFRDFITRLKGKISSGTSIVIHCRMGIGRASIIASCLMLNSR